jgi:hypothetical protein
MGERLAAAVKNQAPLDLPYVVSATVGTSTLDSMLSLRDAIERADAELYARKRRARRDRSSELGHVDATVERE